MLCFSFSYFFTICNNILQTPFGTTYYASSDGTYYATSTTDPSQHGAITAYATQADGTTVLPVTGQRAAFRAVTTGEHSGLQQIVLAVSEASSGSAAGSARQEIVAIPATLTPQVTKDNIFAVVFL